MGIRVVEVGVVVAVVVVIVESGNMVAIFTSLGWAGESWYNMVASSDPVNMVARAGNMVAAPSDLVLADRSWCNMVASSDPVSMVAMLGNMVAVPSCLCWVCWTLGKGCWGCGRGQPLSCCSGGLSPGGIWS